MIYLIGQKATADQVHEMLEELKTMIKVVVDIEREVLAGGGEMHSDCEALLLDDGSKQADLWGANWYPERKSVEFESLINIRPQAGNRSMIIQSKEICQKVESITRNLLEEDL